MYAIGMRTPRGKENQRKYRNVWQKLNRYAIKMGKKPSQLTVEEKKDILENCGRTERFTLAEQQREINIQQVFEYITIKRWTILEVSQLLGLNVNTIHKYLEIGRARSREEFKKLKSNQDGIIEEFQNNYVQRIK